MERGWYGHGHLSMSSKREVPELLISRSTFLTSGIHVGDSNFDLLCVERDTKLRTRLLLFNENS